MNKQEQLKIDLRLAKELQVQIDRVSAELSAVNESNFTDVHKNEDGEDQV